jgi:3-mercaptopyruvate sulfurtransferase SseA
MRHFLTALAVVALTGAASAQYKTPAPQGTPAIPVSPNPNVQITPVNPAEQTLESARRIAREEAIKMVAAGKAVYIDVRPKDQFDIEHIKGAVSVPLGELTARVKELPKNKFLITYCA